MTTSSAEMPAQDREHSIDCLRGVAVLGILAMNIIAFAYPGDAYVAPNHSALNPYLGEFRGVSAAIWWVCYVVFDLKMMAIFSMLFGAGCVLLGRSRERFAGLYYRRLGFLFVVGVIHAFLIWFGDILLWYSLCGLILYPFRKERPWLLATVGILMMAVPALVGVISGRFLSVYPEQIANMAPTAEKAARQIEQVRSGLGGSIAYTAGYSVFFQLAYFPLWGWWRITGLMLLGMALMRRGFFSAAWSTRAYAWTAAVGGIVGLALVIPGGFSLSAPEAGPEHMNSAEGQLNYVGSVPMALAYAAGVMLAVRTGVLAGLRERLAAAGRMAFTNYLSTSLILTFCFNGWGLGLFGRFERPTVYLFVLGVWALQLWWSPWWLRRFTMGPLEWLWRTASYLKAPPLRRALPCGAQEAA